MEYVDAETGLPLGCVRVFHMDGAIIDSETHRPVPRTDSKPDEMHLIQIVKRFERLPATPENLALLDAPAIDAGKPNRP